MNRVLMLYEYDAKNELEISNGRMAVTLDHLFDFSSSNDTEWIKSMSVKHNHI
ncbi:MAG: hypothetical protein OQJ97_15380 [Rhodospirillales bacterium]|nr:hypothetical protein [Rhodospirillales bacterium]